MENPFEALDKRLNNIEVFLLNFKESLPDLLQNTPTENELQHERLINKKEAAHLLGVSLSTIDNYRRKGILTPKKIRVVVRFKYSEVLQAIDELQKA